MHDAPVCKNVQHTSSSLVPLCLLICANAGINGIRVVSFFTCMPWVMLQYHPASRISEVICRTAADPDSIRQDVLVTFRPLVRRCLATTATVASFCSHVGLRETVLLYATASAVNCRLVHVHVLRLSPFLSLTHTCELLVSHKNML